MGKGDRKTRRGKIRIGSHGKVRPHNGRITSTSTPDVAVTVKSTPRKAPARKK